MRVLLAGLFVFGSMLTTVGLIASSYPEDHWPWWAALAPAIALLVSLGAAMFIFNGPGFRPSFSPKSLAEQIADLERKGLVIRQSFKAIRAFSVEEFDDEGSHYYIELDNGNVLYLSGQYLYDFEPITDDPEINQERTFPCTEFEILRHRIAGYVLDILCRGMVLEPEAVANHYTKSDWKKGIPEDGAIISNRSYDELKRERLSV
jgi:hypothetical protein